MKQAAAKPPASFESALRELEDIVRALEDGGAPLETSLQAYARGTELLRYCQDTLAQAEQQIRILDGNGLRDLEHGATDEGGSK